MSKVKKENRINAKCRYDFPLHIKRLDERGGGQEARLSRRSIDNFHLKRHTHTHTRSVRRYNDDLSSRIVEVDFSVVRLRRSGIFRINLTPV